jgi:site-specific DNA-methyltransferase (adenine-specific)
MITLINADFREALSLIEPVKMIFADPPDNIGLAYGHYDDKIPAPVYAEMMDDMIYLSAKKADMIWISYNPVNAFLMGYLFYHFLEDYNDWEAKHCVQTFTFGQHNCHDLGVNHRLLVRLMRKGTLLYPNAIRVPSWRQLHGDKRANPHGRVPGDVFDFPRVVGNSKQRRRWHPTQLNEGLYERCIRLSCAPDDMVCDIFAGTGTLARVCERTNNSCILIEVNCKYCTEIVKEHGLKQSNCYSPLDGWRKKDE